MAQVMMPQRKEDSLTTIAKALGIASQIYGIRTNMAQLDDFAAKREAEEKTRTASEANKKRVGQGILNRAEQIELSKTHEISPTKPEGVASFQIADEESGSPLYASVRQAKQTPLEKAKEKLVAIDTVDEKGNPVTMYATPKAGQMFPKAPKADPNVKMNQEFTERYNNLVSNAEKLKGLVKQHGTFELAGTAGEQMDGLIYNMAIDYATVVDPASVAREGEVAAAQKYTLPIRNGIVSGLGMKNSTAVSLIDDYIGSLQDRVKNRELAQQGVLVQPQAENVAENIADSGVAQAAPPKREWKDGDTRVNPEDGQTYVRINNVWLPKPSQEQAQQFFKNQQTGR